MGALRHSQPEILRRRLLSKPRWRPKRQKQFTANDRRSRSSRTPGSKSDVDSGNFDAGDKREQESMEATWACLSYNIIRWFSIRRKLNAAAAAAAA